MLFADLPHTEATFFGMVLLALAAVTHLARDVKELFGGDKTRLEKLEEYVHTRMHRLADNVNAIALKVERMDATMTLLHRGCPLLKKDET